MEKYTWNGMVEESMNTVLNLAAEGNDLEKAMYKVINDRMREHFDTISLARIATALYKLADIPDEVDETYFDTVKEMAEDE